VQSLKSPPAQAPAASAPPATKAPAAAAAVSSGPTAAEASGRETRKKMSRVRGVIAKRLVEAKNSTAMLTTFNEVDLSRVMELRTKHKDSFLKKHGVKLGFMSFFVKASVAALEAFPDINAYIDGNDIIYRNYYDIGIAVGTDRGLFVPVIRDCEKKNFAEIEQGITDFAGKARDGKISMDDLQGGGFTITNGGVYGSLLSTPILNIPQSAILGMHTIQKRPVAIDGKVEIRPMMYLALSYDHRVVDGKEAVSFLVNIKKTLEEPSRFYL
jgi:2-oxoglutarate dehydrogenase E2 component (dihydrolipoamide succinyltransferase)